MTDSPAVRLTNFSHICVGVTAMPAALDFYRDILGLEVVFDVDLDGEALDTVTVSDGARGRMVGLTIPGSGVVVELLCFGPVSKRRGSAAARLGYTNMSFNVEDLDEAHEGCEAAGAAPGPIADFDGVRMFFLHDPDGTPIEIVEFPGDATSNLEYHQRR
jgi:glyoxylase I family protein